MDYRLNGPINGNIKFTQKQLQTLTLSLIPEDYFFENEVIMLISFARSDNRPQNAAILGLAFTEAGYDALIRQEQIQKVLYDSGRITEHVPTKKKLWESEIKSGR